MESLISFRLLADELNNNEMQQFLSELMKQYGSDFIVKAIFNELMHSITKTNANSDSKQYLCNCGEILSQIVDESNIHINCDECEEQINPHTPFWHCKKETNDIHPVGFDICNKCIYKYTTSSFRINQVNKMNKMISNVINARKKTKVKSNNRNNNNQNNCLSLDTLPSELISETASFLPTFSYFILQRVNRKLYIGCNTPFSLRTFDAINNNYKLPINWNKLKSIKSLSLNKNHIQNLLNHNSNIQLNNVTALTLDNLEFSSLKEIQTFTNRKCINVDNIETLSLRRFGNVSEQSFPSFIGFLKFLSPFRKVKDIDFNRIHLHIQNNYGCMKNILPNVECIKRSGGHKIFWNSLSAIRGSQVVFLDCYYNSIFKENIHSFSNLQKLRIRKTDAIALKFISDKIKCFLKEIHIDFNTNIKPYDGNIQEHMKNLMKTQINLECIKIKSKYNLCKWVVFNI